MLAAPRRSRAAPPCSTPQLTVGVPTAIALGLLLGAGGIASIVATQQPVSPRVPDNPVIRTLLRGLAYRESQVEQVHAEATVDSYYPPAYWDTVRGLSSRDELGGQDRDRTVVRFSASDAYYTEEARPVYFGGGGIFFAISAEEFDPWDTGLLRIKRGAINGRGFEVLWRGGPPIAREVRVDPPSSGLASGWLPAVLGLTEPTSGRWTLQETVTRNLNAADEVAVVESDESGLSCHVLTTWQRTDTGGVARFRYWFASEHDGAIIKCERCGTRGAAGGPGYRYVATWSDFAPVEGLTSPFPRRHTQWHLSSSGEGGDAQDTLTTVLDFSISWITAQELSPAPLLVRDAFPVGSIITHAASDAADAPSLDVLQAMERNQDLLNDTAAWAGRPWEVAVPKLPGDCMQPLDRSFAEEVNN
jgi:hypothetical protein